MRTLEQINRIKNRLAPPYAVEQFLTNTEITKLIQLFENTQQDKVYKNTGPITLTLELDNPLIASIIDRIKSKIGLFEVTAAFFFYTETPHIIHNDDTFELPEVYKGITLPLRIDGTGIPKLCFFKQHYFHGPAKFFNGSKDVPTYYNKQVYNYTEVDGIVDTAFIDKQNILTHLRSSWLNGLSLDRTLDWVPGNALIFDSVQLHCASDFTQLNINAKLGISIFTKL
jgi:hypothetical protein